MDSIKFDFEANTIEIKNSGEQGTRINPNLSAYKDDILKAAHIESLDISDIVSLVNSFLNGEVSEEEFAESADTIRESENTTAFGESIQDKIQREIEYNIKLVEAESNYHATFNFAVKGYFGAKALLSLIEDYEERNYLTERLDTAFAKSLKVQKEYISSMLNPQLTAAQTVSSIINQIIGK